MFDQTFLDNKGRRRPWAYLLGLAGELFALGVLLLLPLIYTERIGSFGFSHLPISLPAHRDPRPPEQQQVAASQQTRIVRTTNPHPFFLPPRTQQNTQVDLGEPEITPVTFTPGGDGPVGLERFGIAGNAQVAAAPPPHDPPVQKRPPPEAPKAKPTGPIRVGGEVMEAKIIRRIIPVYPPLARQARVQGTVRLLGVIAKDGTIQQLQVLSGHPLLVPAAVEAVKQWLYRPTLLNGEAVEVMAPIDVNFTLSQ